MLRILLVVTLSLGLFGCSSIRSAKLFAPNWFGFTEIADRVYVNDKMPEDQRQQLLATLAAARGRVVVFFGSVESAPRIVACSTEQCYVSSGGVSAKGKAYGATVLLLSPRGLNTVIAAHELSHIELHTRVGVFRAWRRVPAWFDEGLAVLVSDDPRFNETDWLAATDQGRNAPELDAIGTTVRLGDSSWQLTYGTARRAVGAWYAHAGRAGLLRLMAALRGGADFDTALADGAATGALEATPYTDAPLMARR